MAGHPIDADADPVLWRRDAPYPALANDGLPPEADVVVVGGGYTGLSAATELARRGRSVVVLERGELGAGASARNGGFVHPGLKLGLSRLSSKLGGLGLELYRETEKAMAHIGRVVSEDRIECSFEPCGYMYLAEGKRQAAALADTQRSLERDASTPGQILTRDRLTDEVGTRNYRAGLLVHNAASIHPARFHCGLARTSLESGATLLANTAALALVERPDRIVVETTAGEVRAGEVLVATDGYTDKLDPWLRRRIIPIDSFIIATERLAPELLAQVSPKGHLCFESKNFLCYWRTHPDGRMLFGGRPSFAPTDVASAQRILQERLVAIYPALAGTRIETSWGGKVGFTFDRLPHVVRRGRIFAAMGYCGGGVALATYLGHRTAEWMNGGEAPVFARLPFRTAPLYRGRPWFLRPAGQWFRLRDRLG